MSNSKGTRYIQNCLAQYEKDFPDDWIEGLSWGSIADARDSFRAGMDLIKGFAVFCFINIAKSLLSGEYIVDRSKFNKVKTDFQKYWDNEHLCPPGSITDQEILNAKSRLYSLYSLLDAHLKALFNSYTSFVVSVDEKLEYSKHVYLFKVETDQPDYTMGLHYFGYLRKLIIPLCEIEHYLEFSDKVRGLVSEYVEQFRLFAEEESDAEIKEVFLLASIKARFIQKKLLREGDSFEILINCDNRKVSRNSINDLPEPLTSLFSFYERIHENKPYNESEISSIQMNIVDDDASFTDMAILMNYYCSTNKSLQQINNLLASFDRKFAACYHRSFHFAFDNHAICTLSNFMHNCRLAYRIKQHSYTITELKEDIEAIELLQGRTFVKNFYPYKKAIEFLGNLIRANIAARNIEFEYEPAITLYTDYLSKFDSNVEWCEAHKFYPIQSVFKECVVSINGNRLFVPSTITRPIDYKKLKEIQLNFHTELDFFRTSQIYLKDKKDTESIKEELHSIEKRYLQIGSILVGVVTFLFGTINIFTQGNASPQDMFLSTLGLGLVLIIFASLIVIVTERFWNERPNKKRIAVCGIIIAVHSVIIAILAFNPAFPKLSSAESDSKLDSIGTEKVDTVVPSQPIIVKSH